MTHEGEAFIGKPHRYTHRPRDHREEQIRALISSLNRLEELLEMKDERIEQLEREAAA